MTWFVFYLVCMGHTNAACTPVFEGVGTKQECIFAMREMERSEAEKPIHMKDSTKPYCIPLSEAPVK